MTDRLSGLLVVFEKDVRVDDAESIKNAIRQFRGVIDVDDVEGGVGVNIATKRAKYELAKALFKVLGEERELE